MTPDIYDDVPAHSPQPWRVVFDAPGVLLVLDAKGGVVATLDPAARPGREATLLGRLLDALFPPERPHRLHPARLRNGTNAVLCAAAPELVAGLKAVWVDVLTTRKKAAERSDGFLIASLDAIAYRLAELTDFGPYGPEPVAEPMTAVKGGAS